MNTILLILVKQYYRLNTGFFLLLFLIVFGVVNLGDTLRFHYAIMQRAYMPQVFLMLSAVWLAYNIKCTSFVYRSLQAVENNFLYQLQALTTARQMNMLCSVQTLIFLPALLYAFITATVLFTKARVIAGILVLLFQLLMIFLPVLLYRQKINNTCQLSKTALLMSHIPIASQRRRFIFWPLYYLADQRKGALLGIKAGSLILLQAMVSYNKTRLNLESICVLMMGLIAAHAILPYYVRSFVEERLVSIRALPLTISARFGWFATTYAILLLPELLFLLLHTGGAIGIGMLLLIYFVSVAQLCLFSSLLYIKGLRVEKYMLLVAALFFASLLLLATLPAWLFGIAILLLSFILFAALYNNWEAS